VGDEDDDVIAVRTCAEGVASATRLTSDFWVELSGAADESSPIDSAGPKNVCSWSCIYDCKSALVCGNSVFESVSGDVDGGCGVME